MFENFISFFKKLGKKDGQIGSKTNKEEAKERLHLVLMQDRANVSADFLDMMKQEIIDVIKKYIDVDENDIDVRLTNKQNSDGTTGAPALYANIPIISIKNEARKIVEKEAKQEKIDNENENKEEETKKKEEVKKENKEKKEDNNKLQEPKKEKTEVKENVNKKAKNEKTEEKEEKKETEKVNNQKSKTKEKKLNKKK